MQSTASARFIVLALFLAAVNGLKVSNFPGKVLQRNQYVEPVLNGDATISVLAKFCAYPIPWKLGQPDPNRYLVSTLEIKSDTHAKDCKIVVAAINRLLASFRPGLRPIGCEQFKHYPDKSFFGLNYTYPYTPDEEKEIEAIEIALDKLLGTKRGVNPIKFGFSGSVNVSQYPTACILILVFMTLYPVSRSQVLSSFFPYCGLFCSILSFLYKAGATGGTCLTCYMQSPLAPGVPRSLGRRKLYCSSYWLGL